MKIHIIDNPISDIIKIYMKIEDAPDQRAFVEYGNNHMMIKHDMSGKEGQEPPVFMEIRRDIFDSFLNQMIEYGNNNGIKMENENKLQGKIEATERHLKDLQAITKKVLKINV